MRPRPPGPRRRDRLFIHALQQVRLERLTRGEIDPVGPREALFVAALWAGERPHPDDYILPFPLMMAEIAAVGEARSAGAPQAESAAPAEDAPPALHLFGG